MNDYDVDVRADAFDDPVDGRGRLNAAEVRAFDSVQTPKEFGLNLENFHFEIIYVNTEKHKF